MRFIVQWIASEKARASIVPETFWYFSFVGGFLLLAYAVYRADPVFILGQATGLVIYSRNIYFIWVGKREPSAVTAADPLALRLKRHLAAESHASAPRSHHRRTGRARTVIGLFGFLLIDPFVLERSKTLSPEAVKFFRTITDVGTSNWMLIPTGAAIAVALVLRKRHVGFRNEAAYGLIASTIGFVFVSVGGAGLIASLTKNIVGRARPKLFDSVGPLDFKLFAFDPDYASFPSGHATNIFAFATVIGMLWPRGGCCSIPSPPGSRQAGS